MPETLKFDPEAIRKARARKTMDGESLPPGLSRIAARIRQTRDRAATGAGAPDRIAAPPKPEDDEAA